MRISEDSRLSDRRVLEWFLLEKGRKEEHQTAQTHPAQQPVVTISRQYGAGGRTVANLVAGMLGPDWQVWDREIIDAVAQSARERSEMVQMMDQHTQSWMDQMVRSLFNVRFMEPHAFHNHLVQVVLALAQQGRKVIVGRGANFILPGAINVRLEGSEETRIRNVMLQQELGREEAARKMHQTDRERAEFTRTVFGREVSDRTAYDLIIRVDGIDFNVAASAIAAAVWASFPAIKPKTAQAA